MFFLKFLPKHFLVWLRYLHTSFTLTIPIPCRVSGCWNRPFAKIKHWNNPDQIQVWNTLSFYLDSLNWFGKIFLDWFCIIVVLKKFNIPFWIKSQRNNFKTLQYVSYNILPHHMQVSPCSFLRDFTIKKSQLQLLSTKQVDVMP